MKRDFNQADSSKASKQLLELEEVIATYDLWDEWIDSPGCFLKKQEKDGLLYFLQLHSIRTVAKQLGVSVGHTSTLLNRTKHRLRWNHKYYRQWVGDKILEEAGAYDHFSMEDKFLGKPLHYHKMHQLLYYSLRECGETLGDILLVYNERDLLQRKNFGNKKLSYLQGYLKENNCSHLLKKKAKDGDRADK